MDSITKALVRMFCTLIYSITFCIGLVIPALALEFIWRVVL